MSKIITPALATLFLITTPVFAQSDAGQIKATVVDHQEAAATTGGEAPAPHETREKGWSDEQIKTITGKEPAPATADQGTFDEAERTLQRVTATQDDAPDDDARVPSDETLSAQPDRKTQGEAED